jgi:hypothetical protein
VAADQYALTDLAPRRACGITAAARTSAFGTAIPDADEAWLEDIRPHKPAVLHFKGARWKAEGRCAGRIEAARRDVAT